MWTNKKFTHAFKSSYERDSKGERNFILTATKGSRRITFESWQQVKAMGGG